MNTHRYTCLNLKATKNYKKSIWLLSFVLSWVYFCAVFFYRSQYKHDFTPTTFCCRLLFSSCCFSAFICLIFFTFMFCYLGHQFYYFVLLITLYIFSSLTQFVFFRFPTFLVNKNDTTEMAHLTFCWLIRQFWIIIVLPITDVVYSVSEKHLLKIHMRLVWLRVFRWKNQYQHWLQNIPATAIWIYWRKNGMVVYHVLSMKLK